MSKLRTLLLYYLTEIRLIILIIFKKRNAKKGKLEEASHRSNTFMETYYFQLHYFSIGYEWEMEN